MEYYCKECKTGITSKEHEFSIKKYGLPLCRIHQNGNPSNKDDMGLSKRESKYKESMIKGRIAETLIEELFLSLEFNVYRYGMENTVPGIMKLLKGVRSDVAHMIRKMPDFVIQNTKTGEVFFIEVKFRANEEFSIGDIDKDYPFENAFFMAFTREVPGDLWKPKYPSDLRGNNKMTVRIYDNLDQIKFRHLPPTRR